jgi:hypothetical protein
LIIPVIDVVPVTMIEMQELEKSKWMIGKMIYDKIIDGFVEIIRTILRTKT